jgi:hypothetical protein
VNPQTQVQEIRVPGTDNTYLGREVELDPGREWLTLVRVFVLLISTLV